MSKRRLRDIAGDGRHHLRDPMAERRSHAVDHRAVAARHPQRFRQCHVRQGLALYAGNHRLAYTSRDEALRLAKHGQRGVGQWHGVSFTGLHALGRDSAHGTIQINLVHVAPRTSPERAAVSTAKRSAMRPTVPLRRQAAT